MSYDRLRATVARHRSNGQGRLTPFGDAECTELACLLAEYDSLVAQSGRAHVVSDFLRRHGSVASFALRWVSTESNATIKKLAPKAATEVRRDAARAWRALDRLEGVRQ
jgi:hypothetical protein